MSTKLASSLLAMTSAMTLSVDTIAAQKSSAELAKQLANPVAALISVPFQYNYDENIGPDDKGSRHTLNIQPVIPMDISDDWNLISRTILPVIDQTDVAPGAGSQSGTGDVVQSLFFSPKAPTDSGWIWGVGPAFLLPTGSDDLLTADKWGIGPTAVALKQSGPWTLGMLTNHITSVAGEDDRDDVSSTLFQPFIHYGTPNGMTYSVNSEATYDWKGNEGAVPVNFQINKVSKVDGQMVQYGVGLRYWAQSTEAGPEGLAFRLNFVLLFPK